MVKRSIAQRMRERTGDLGVAEGYMDAGKAPPKVGRAVRPKPLAAPKKKKKK